MGKQVETQATGVGAADALGGVDRAALVLAASAGGLGVALADGDWSVLSTFAGALLGVMVVAFRRPSPQLPSIRTWLIRLAFGLTAALCVYLIVA